MTDRQLINKTLEETLKQLSDILNKKFDDYANEDNGFSNFEKMSNLLEQDVKEVFVFYMSIKIARLVELIKRNKEPKNESIEDTINDLIGYSVLFKSYINKKSGTR
jgi:hypothetical protein